MKKPPKFATEADLCAAFIAWAETQGVRCYAEWGGWDILLVYHEGWQIGIQAKLRLNATVILQAVPDKWRHSECGPDYRAILVPDQNGLAEVASRLGLVMFSPAGYRPGAFVPELRGFGDCTKPSRDWVDWNPSARLKVPETSTGSIAGSPCPVTLTPWKLGALAVLAELAVVGTITAKRIRHHGIDPGRWTQSRWLEPSEKRGDWVRSEKCPRFDEQHPEAYAVALAKARAAVVPPSLEEGA